MEKPNKSAKRKHFYTALKWIIGISLTGLILMFITLAIRVSQ